VVERQAHAEFSQALQSFELRGTVVDDRAIADLELHASWVECRVAERFFDGRYQAPVMQLLRRQIDSHGEIRQFELALP
jgi:hypothetical protein